MRAVVQKWAKDLYLVNKYLRKITKTLQNKIPQRNIGKDLLCFPSVHKGQVRKAVPDIDDPSQTTA